MSESKSIDMAKAPTLTFDQFKTLCDEAGLISSPEDMEADYYVGNVMADVVEQLQCLIETTPAPANMGEGKDSVTVALAAVDFTADPAAVGEALVHLAAAAIRSASVLCRDDGTD